MHVLVHYLSLLYVVIAQSVEVINRYTYVAIHVYYLLVYGYQNLNSSIHLATKYNYTKVVEILGEAGADVNAVNKVQH